MAGKLIDLTGQTFNRWSVLGLHSIKKKTSRWLCRCDCGTERPVTSSSLKNGMSASCGCYWREVMSSYTDLTGQMFTYWQVLSYSHSVAGYGAKFLCRCKCGTERGVFGGSLLSGHSQSCGCYKAERAGELKTTHGQSVEKTAAYRAWASMRGRCLFSKPGTKSYKNYRSRGITICPEWDDFLAFYRDMGDPPPGTTLDRIDNNGNYEASNCRWATRSQQNANCRVRCDTRVYEWRGQQHVLSEWAAILGIRYDTLRQRLKKGYSLDEAFSLPIVTDYNSRGFYNALIKNREATNFEQPVES